jgi:regulator of sigma E protease
MIYVVVALGLAMLMVVHEAGHLLAARAYGMRVTRFSIGFGPTFFKIVPKDGHYWFTTAGDRVRFKLFRHDEEKHGPTIYQVAMIPFLAYVQVAGMNPLEEVDPNDKGSYANASLWARIVTIVGGPLANYLFASILFFVSYFVGGRPTLTTEVSVLEGRPAAAAHLEDGDKIIAIDGKPIADWEQMADAISRHPGETISVVVDRHGEKLTKEITPANEGGKGKIGVAARARTHVPVSAKEAAIMALEEPPKVVKNVVIGLGEWVTGKAEGDLSGPVGIVKEGARAARSGWTELVLLLGALSAYLGAFNLIPFPALDGGRLMFLGYEAATRKRPNARIEAHIHAVGLLMMLTLMAYVTYNDFHGGPK